MLKILGTRVVWSKTSRPVPMNLDKFGRIKKNLTRCCSTEAGSKVLEHLSNRSLLRVAGNESSSFLQGLITNDMRLFEDGAASMYTLFLNTKGRVMYDAILYKTQENGVYYIECDAQALTALEKHLKMYRVRRKIDIDSLEDKMKIWVEFNPNVGIADENNSHYGSGRPGLEGQIFPCESRIDRNDHKSRKIMEDISIYQDPRLHDLGLRIITGPDTKPEEIIMHVDPDVVGNKDTLSYRAFRYKLGIGEGVEDLPPGKAFPLEANCDYLHGVNFHKGCYIGQELTARTHHTGVVRKRLMPLVFDQSPDKIFEYEEKILNDSGKAVGKLRGQKNKFGLGLLRIADALDSRELNILGLKLKAVKPAWWPQEAPKERISAG